MLSDLACLHKWVAGTYGLKSAALSSFLVQETAIRITLLGNGADEEEEEMEMASGNGLKRHRVVGAPSSSSVGKNYPNMLCYWVDAQGARERVKKGKRKFPKKETGGGKCIASFRLRYAANITPKSFVLNVSK